MFSSFLENKNFGFIANIQKLSLPLEQLELQFLLWQVDEFIEHPLIEVNLILPYTGASSGHVTTTLCLMHALLYLGITSNPRKSFFCVIVPTINSNLILIMA